MARSRIVLLCSLVLLALSTFTGCDLLFPKGGDNGITVGGTITAAYYPMSGPITVTISDGSTSLSTQVSLSASSGPDSAAYSVSGLAAGSYDVTVTFTSAYPPSQYPGYSINGTAQVSPAINVSTPSTFSPYEVTVSILGLSIGSSETLDIDLGNLG